MYLMAPNRVLTPNANNLLNLLQIPLYDQMLDIRPAYHESLPLLEINSSQLSLDGPTVLLHTHKHMQILRGLLHARSDIHIDVRVIDVRRERRAESHSARIILS